MPNVGSSETSIDRRGWCETRLYGGGGHRRRRLVQGQPAHQCEGTGNSCRWHCRGTPGRITLPLVSRYVDDMVVVEEEEITQAMMLLLKRCKLLVKGAGAVGLAAVLAGKIQVAGKRVAVVLSGGNVDTNLIARVLEHGLVHAGRYLVLRIMLEDRPGQLSRLLNIVSNSNVNVLDIGHLRHAPSVHMGQVEIQLTLETKDLAHSIEVRERLREAGYAPYESEPLGGLASSP